MSQLIPGFRAIHVTSPTSPEGATPADRQSGMRAAQGSGLAVPAGAAAGGVRWLLRFEGVAVFIAAVAAYAHLGAGWGAFAALFLLPDFAFLAYLAGPRWGALAYNATHAYPAPVALVAMGGMPVTLAAGLIWCAHIGFDRALGYGLKYASGFHATHLGMLGRRDPW